MGIINQLLGKIIYGTLFAVVLPLALWLWTAHVTTCLPALQVSLLGALAVATGLVCVLLGMLNLWTIGGGLPMNAYPPAKPVRGGLYAVVPHPIYTGFTLVVAGVSLWSGSATGLWLTTPLIALGCACLVLGFEEPDLRKRFGKSLLPTPWLGIPAGDGPVSLATRLGTAVFTVSIWGILYLGTKALGMPADALETRFVFESLIPVVPQSMPVYTSIYLFVPLAFLLVRDKASLRRLAVGALLATAVNTLLYVTLPLTAEFRVVEQSGWMAQWLTWEQHMAQPAIGSFPSFHVTWAVLVTFVCSVNRPLWLRFSWVLWCIALCISCLTTGMHSLADIIAGVAVGLLVINSEKTWSWLLHRTESLGNGWKSWQFGSVRIINHAIWSGLSGAAGLYIVAAATGAVLLSWVMPVAFAALIGAGLWAQWVEGSSALLRPFGYYGGIIGGLLALAIIQLLGGPGVILIGAFALAGPWIQAIGRLRCIVQGCCHGRPVDWGIRITNPHSRVVKLANFSNQPIHPTPVYSILANLFTSALLMRIWSAGAPALSIAGLYLILAGFARFVEEAYRGEPQTERYFGLPLYQWLAIASSLLGFVVMALPGGQILRVGYPSTLVLLVCVAWGCITAFAMSIDFPNSSGRYSRLTD